MLRHACGFKLANDGHDTRALQHYLTGIPQMNPKLGWIFALLPRFDKTAWRRGRRP
jgi:hypothetical protein